MSKKVRSFGGDSGDEFDDGVYDIVRKMCVGEDSDRVSSLEIEYGKGNQLITLSHGNKLQQHDEGGFISSLTFITSVERDREEFGKAVGTRFVLEAKGFDKLVGFQGRSFPDRLNALGAHFAVMITPPVKKLEARGGNFGDEWDDGIHDNVCKIKVKQDHESVEMVKFKYVNGTEIVSGEPHGDTSEFPFVEENILLSQDEYITSVHGHYGTGYIGITMLKFKTNKATYQVLKAYTDGYENVGTSFVLGEASHKIVGFHGKSSRFSIGQIGVYVSPINNA
ncbi:jacalin-related lectin 45 [Capsella rubella]|uniref:jacalin-related lectin 45 n=1 Tax=Capsella rubella TaxID=81985 RepID=UPI000CD5C637|nr:jacalin-related lectin 45 [Capsella rubella]